MESSTWIAFVRIEPMFIIVIFSIDNSTEFWEHVKLVTSVAIVEFSGLAYILYL
jgi:hypothetical protein